MDTSKDLMTQEILKSNIQKSIFKKKGGTKAPPVAVDSWFGGLEQR